MRKTLTHIVFSIALGIPVSTVAFADEAAWPRGIVGSKGTIVLYQQQLESFRRDSFTVRAALRAALPRRSNN